MSALLSVRGLTVTVPPATRNGPRRVVVDDVSFDIERGQMLGLVGESGSGKSMTARSSMRLLRRGVQASGTVLLDGTDLMTASDEELRRVRAGRVAMVFQDPRAHVNPVRTVGQFLNEAMVAQGSSPDDASRRAAALLAEVGIPDGERRLGQYPHELSGGLLQRVMIAAAMAVEPDLLLADEPTTALDVTTQSEVMAIIDDLRRERGLAVLFITHDLELAAATCDETAVMYAGRIVERRGSAALHRQPRHPYSAGLLVSRPTLDEHPDLLPVIPGSPIAAFEAGAGCAFAARCAYAVDACATAVPALEEDGSGQVACLRWSELGDLAASAKDDDD